MKEKENITRRSFFKKVWTWLGIIASLELAGISLAFLLSGKKRSAKGKKSSLTVIGRIEDVKPGEVYPYRNGKLYLVREADGAYLALSLKCTHLGCSIHWDEDKDKFICPCHSSEFDRHGDVLKPPAPHALDAYKVVIEEGMVKVDLDNVIKRKKYEKSDLTYA